VKLPKTFVPDGVVVGFGYSLAYGFVTLLAIIVIFPILGALGDRFYSVFENEGSAFMPDGTFSLDPSSFRWFSSAGLFQITLGFGLRFTQAKTIDIAWDIVSYCCTLILLPGSIQSLRVDFCLGDWSRRSSSTR
jgi:hypothetical protein